MVVANILAAPLIDMAPALSRRVGHHGQLVLSGVCAPSNLMSCGPIGTSACSAST